MPSSQQILASLKHITDTFQTAAVLWHLYFAALVIALLSGAEFKKRHLGIFLAVPLLSVGIAAWSHFNPFNGTMFILLPMLLIYFSLRMPPESVSAAPSWAAAPGIIMILFGWVYPHFVDPENFLVFLYKAPLGIIPCPTLSVVTGFAILYGGFGSRAFSLILSITGIFYGLTGVVQLGVYIDIVLLAGALFLFALSFMKLRSKEKEEQGNMTAFGVGPRVALILFPYLGLTIFAHINDPAMMRMTDSYHFLFPAAGTLLILTGIFFWGSGAFIIEKAFKEGKLLQSGGYGLVRNPMYASVIFITTGVALWMRSWAVLTVPFLSVICCLYLIKKEEEFLEKKFGAEYLEYKKKVKAIIPFVKIGN